MTIVKCDQNMQKEIIIRKLYTLLYVTAHAIIIVVHNLTLFSVSDPNLVYI